MKKIYLKPEVEAISINTEMPLAVSSVQISGDAASSSVGCDARRRNFSFDEEDEDF